MKSHSPAPAPQSASADSADEQSIELTGRSGSSVHATVRTLGSGTRFCFLHGLVGLNDHWATAAQMVSDEAQCTLFQLPLLQLRGADCSIYGATELTARFLRRYCPDPVVLVGNSFGGHIATRVALDHPDQVAGLVLTGSSGLIERTTVKEIQLRPSREWLGKRLAEIFYHPRHISESDLDRAHEELSSRGGQRAMIKLSRSARKDHLGARLGEIQCPTLLVWGRQDCITPPEAAEGFARSIPGSKLIWFEECGHAPMIEKPEAFSDQLRAFARLVESRGTTRRSPTT